MVIESLSPRPCADERPCSPERRRWGRRWLAALGLARLLLPPPPKGRDFIPGLNVPSSRPGGEDTTWRCGSKNLAMRLENAARDLDEA